MKNIHYARRIRLATYLPIVLSIALLPVGCSQDEEAKPAQVKVTKTTAAARANKRTADSTEPEKQMAKAEFIAPFPEKSDIFSAAEPPKQAPKAEVKPVVQEKRPAVRLLGFVNVGEPQAILSIDNQTSVLKPDDIRQNVRLVAIDAQAATLEFKTQRWSLHLLQKTSDEQAMNVKPNAAVSSAAKTSTPNVPSLPSLPSFGTLN